MSNLLLQAIVVGLLTGGIYGLFAVGLSLILGVANIMTFVHGDFLMIAMYLTLAAVALTSADPYIGILLVVPGMVLLAYMSFKYVPAVTKITKFPQMNQMLYMLGFSYLIQNVVLMFLGARHQIIQTAMTEYNFFLGDVFVSMPRLIAGVTSVILTLLLMWVIKNTDLGRTIRAASQDREAASMMGINVDRTYMLAWIIGIGSLGFAGPMLSSIFSFHPIIGNYYLMIGFMCVVMGGLGNIGGALIGGVIMGVALELGNVFLPGSSGPILPFLVFVVVLIFRPEGIFGKPIRSAR
ncbi:MAG: branched-chain amino acid ABC transporter permease [Chloroflexota bacterium]|jgi:branched-chain amino acid transport system permease protein